MAYLPWVIMFLLSIMQFWRYPKHNNNLLLPWHLLISKLLKLVKKKLTTSFIASFFTIRFPYKNTNPTQEQFLKDLVFHIAKSYHLLWDYLMRLPLTWLIKPWNVMLFLHWLKPPQLQPHLIYGCLEPASILVHLLLITSTKNGNHVIL